MKLKNNKVMQRIGKYKYMVDAQNEADLDATNSYFIIEFECDSKIYVGWTGESQKSVKQKLYELIYYSFKKGNNWLSRNNPDLCKAFNDSKYITVSVIKRSEEELSEGLSAAYNGLYTLIDKYSCYFPNGYNIINQLNKCPAEKGIIQQFASKWKIPDTIKRNGTQEKSYSGRPVYEYRRISEDTFAFHKQWNSIKEYADSVEPFKISPSAIYMCCNGQRRIAYGSMWRFDNSESVIQAPDMRKCRGASVVKRTLEKKTSDRIAKYRAKQLKIEENEQKG